MLATTGFGHEDHALSGIPHLDHVFLIMMENHGLSTGGRQPE
jgi:hypothetical protein